MAPDPRLNKDSQIKSAVKGRNARLGAIFSQMRADYKRLSSPEIEKSEERWTEIKRQID